MICLVCRLYAAADSLWVEMCPWTLAFCSSNIDEVTEHPPHFMPCPAVHNYYFECYNLMNVRLHLAGMNPIAKIKSQFYELLVPCPGTTRHKWKLATLKCDGFETVFNNNSTCSKGTAAKPLAACSVGTCEVSTADEAAGASSWPSLSSAEDMNPYMPSWRAKTRIFFLNYLIRVRKFFELNFLLFIKFSVY